ncbi:hypothetical protein [Caldibacillus thermoamylovorans]|uniref:hypothetical protein n=1 Tax=Caldibacillus thermoamylovorans TaxID=35841 RepID=UPI00203DDED8|nr:hypothetical protein [Caldibacillus thermoamylovorans]MCM3478772.1 hypothetical protein [Caldibacillus thermoamylovorans]
MARNGDFKDLIYILVNTRDHYVISNGITFPGFIQSLKKPLANLLLLKHKYDDTEFHLDTQLDYILKDQVEQLIRKGVHKFGEFCWVDFDDVFSLDTIEGEELAELLYLGHMKKHLSLPFFQKLNNRFAYLTEDDGWLNKTYYRYWTDFYDCLGGILASRLSEAKYDKSIIGFRKKKVYPPIERNVLHQLNSVLTEGLVFSFQHFSQERGQIEIPFWVVGDYYDMDEMMEKYLAVSTAVAPHGSIVFDRKQKEWQVNLNKNGN